MKDNSQVSFFDAITHKDVTDAIFKNLAWFLACGALLGVVKQLGSTNVCIALLLFGLSIFLLTLNFVFGVKYILLPLDPTLTKEIINFRHQMAVTSSLISRNLKPILFVFGSLKGWVYMALSFTYVFSALEVVKLVMNKAAG